MNLPAQRQSLPGTESALRPKADHGEQSYRGSGRLKGKVALITGADSGIGKAVAIAFAREGADVAIGYLSEHDDAADTKRWVEEAGQQALLLPGDVVDPAHCRALVANTIEHFGHLEILVNNAAVQADRPTFEEIPDEEWDRIIATNLSAMFHLVKASLPHMEAGASIIGTSSVNSVTPLPTLIPYDVTKAGIANMTAGLAQLVAERGIRVNSVAPGSTWTPLIPSTMPDAVETFGQDAPIGRPAQPAELAPVYVMLASDEASYVSGARIPVTGGQPAL